MMDSVPATQKFDSGAVRDSQDSKLRYDLISPLALKRIAAVYTHGAKKYGDRNWEKGIPMMRTVASLKRHLENWLMHGEPKEQTDDDLAQVAWNAIALLHYSECIQKGVLPQNLDDRPVYRQPYAQQPGVK